LSHNQRRAIGRRRHWALSQRARVGPKARFRQRREGPAFHVSHRPGEWQTYDLRLIARDVTIALNGKTLIDRKEVEGLTAIASDPNEAEPPPIVVQGDHGSVEFRKFTLTPLEKAGAKARTTH
jgi:hypothetical protein